MMLPLIQPVVTMIGIFFVVLFVAATAITASAIIMRSIGLVETN